MIACPADGGAAGSSASFALVLGFVLAGLLLPQQLLAATGAPTSLLPGAAATGDGARPPVLPVQTPREDFPQVTPPAAKVQIQDLSAPDANAIGVLDDAHGGLGTEMWAGSSLTLVQKALPDLPAATPSSVVHGLMRRLLLTTAAVPPGKSAGPDSLVKLRAERLWAMGEVDGLVRLLKGVPNLVMTTDLRRLLVDAALLEGDNGAACGELGILRAAMESDPFPAKLQVYCQIAGGKGNEAGLGVDLLREQKIPDPIFFAAADTSAGIGAGKVGADAWANVSALDLAMARAAKLPVPESAAQQIRHPALVRALATMPSASVEARVVAAERAAAMGSLGVDALRQAYESVTFTTAELAAPVADKSPRGRALLYRASVQQVLPTAKAEIIGKALGAAGDFYPLAARLYAPQIAGLKPQPELAWFAFAASRALFAAGQTEPASLWAGFARAQGLANNEIAVQAQALWALQSLTSGDTDKPVSAAAVAAWRKARADLPVEAQQRRLTVCFGLFAAFGMKVPTEEWLPLFDGPPLVTETVARPAIWHGLRLAAEDLRLGETVLMALASLGERGLAQTDPSDIYRAVAALRLVGLDADARALAVEAAIINGV